MKTILVDAVDTFDIEGKDGFYIFEDMQTLLDSFPNIKILLTSANYEEFIEWGLDKMPYEVFTLKHNPQKTDSSYYSQMLQFFKLEPNEVIYFEHNPDAVKSAESVGIMTYSYDPEVHDLVSLEKFLRENL